MLSLTEKFVHPFTNATTVTIPGTVHNLRTADLAVLVQTNAALRAQIVPGEVTIDSTTFEVTVTFLQLQSGRIILLG